MKTVIFVPLAVYPPGYRERFGDHPTSDDFYDGHYQTARETWDSVEDPDITVLYIRLGDPRLEGHTLYLPRRGLLTDGWFDDALYLPELEFARKHLPFDYAVITNASSYWNKRRLNQKLLTLPRERCAASAPGLLSGAGMRLSRDVVDYLLAHSAEWDYFTSSDVAITRLALQEFPFTTLERQEYRNVAEVEPEGVRRNFHFRCKALYNDGIRADATPVDRSGDLLIMRRIFELEE